MLAPFFPPVKKGHGKAKRFVPEEMDTVVCRRHFDNGPGGVY